MLHLYQVTIQDVQTGEKINLKVKASSTDDATHQLTGGLFGYNGAYRWLGTGLIYENNELINIAE